VIERTGLQEFIAGQARRSSGAPEIWNQWVQTGKYQALTSEPTTVIRTVAEQMPDTDNKADLRAVFQHFKDSPHQFEGFAARVFQMHDTRVIIDQVTQASIDGGRDAIGLYVLGLNDDPVYVDFAGDRRDGGEYRRRSRDFAPDLALATSSIWRSGYHLCNRRQGYEEVRGDRHPIIFIAGKELSGKCSRMALGRVSYRLSATSSLIPCPACGTLRSHPGAIFSYRPQQTGALCFSFRAVM
jgi:hypothetical protein